MSDTDHTKADRANPPADALDPLPIEEAPEPIEPNRRLFQGWRMIAVAGLAAAYAAFHMIALNGVSISGLTGINLPFLPQFPMETWNYRIVATTVARRRC